MPPCTPSSASMSRWVPLGPTNSVSSSNGAYKSWRRRGTSGFNRSRIRHRSSFGAIAAPTPQPSSSWWWSGPVTGASFTGRLGWQQRASTCTLTWSRWRWPASRWRVWWTPSGSLSPRGDFPWVGWMPRSRVFMRTGEKPSILCGNFSSTDQKSIWCAGVFFVNSSKSRSAATIPTTTLEADLATAFWICPLLPNALIPACDLSYFYHEYCATCIFYSLPNVFICLFHASMSVNKMETCAWIIAYLLNYVVVHFARFRFKKHANIFAVFFFISGSVILSLESTFCKSSETPFEKSYVNLLRNPLEAFIQNLWNF